MTGHSASVENVLEQLGSSASGLSAQEAAKRLAADGRNELEESQRISWLRMFLGQFRSLIIWILIAAGIVSGILGDLIDTVAIFAIVVLNAAIGFYQQLKAEKSIAALGKMTSPHAKVLRDGQVVSVPAAEIVVGDVLALAAGDVVAADARLLMAASLKSIESPLTGESEAVTKEAADLAGEVALGDRRNMVFMGTSIAAGTGRAVVVATAMQTELGHIASLIDEAGGDEETPLQRKLDAFGQILIWAALGIVALLFGIGLLRGIGLLELLNTSVGLAVAAVPESLPAVVTVALSLGVLRMARRRALMRKLAAVETLGSTSVICTDKTGTLTIGEMTVRALYVAGQSYEVTGQGYGPAGEVLSAGKKQDAALRELASVLLGCNNAHLAETAGVWETVGDPTEGALLVAGAKAGGDRDRIERELPKVHELPFDSSRKRSTVIRRAPSPPHGDAKLQAFTNGAPGPLLEVCASLYTPEGIRPLTAADREEILAQTSRLARQGLRVLGAAMRDLESAAPTELTVDEVERALVFVGLTGMYDPPRGEAKAAIAKCHAAGIRVVMITGDHPDTAKAIAQVIGICAESDAVIEGLELTKMSDEELRRRAPDVAVYARVTAEHKLRIVRALKAKGAVVAMTGDGVNDAPAIKGADIGIAMGKTGTEVTKQAADMIITDDNFATIVIAVEEGRGIYDNIRKTLQYLLAGNTGELVLMMTCVVIGVPMPLLPIHLLWINLVTDGAPALCLANDPIDSDVMLHAPRGRSERITDHGFLWTMAFTGFLTAGVAFVVYLYVLRTGTLETARASAFAVLVFAELLRSFGARSETKAVWRIPLRTNVSLVVVVAISFALQVGSQHNALLGRFLRTSTIPLADCLILVALGAIPLLVLELLKVVRKMVRRHRGQPRKEHPEHATTN